MLQDKTLDELRAKIDQIDDAMHDLLILRAEVTHAVARVKRTDAPAVPAPPAMRPGREAQILRRLLARHRGSLPPRFIIRIWREIMAASLQAQAKFDLHVYAGDNQREFIDLATAYFGSLTPLRSHARASLVVLACAEQPNSLGVVPAAKSEQGIPWWAQLAAAGQPGPRVLAKLPFLLDGEETELSAYAIGAVEQEDTGDDTTLLRLETSRALTKAVLNDLLKTAGIEAEQIAAGRTADKSAKGFMLLAARGFVAGTDPRLERLRRESDAIVGIDPVGGFANPFVLQAEDEADDPRT